MSLSPTPHCSFCNKSSTTIKLSRCQGCNVVFYCGREHQLADRGDHKRACNAVKKTQSSMVIEERILRDSPGDFMTPPNLFEEHAGHFWGILDTRTYMRARYALVEALLKIKTYTAVEAAHDHIMDMLRLCRGDNMGVRDLVPALKLRLGKDQECYDFCVWYATTGQEGDYDWGDLELPFLDVKNADVFEPVLKHTLHEYGELSHTVGLTLLKIRFLSIVRALRNASMLAERVSQELLDAICLQLVSGTLIAEREDIVNSSNHMAIIRKLQGQIKMLYRAVNAQNEHFWPALLKPGRHLTARPDAFSHGSVQHMQVVPMYNYAAWAETQGAIDVVRELVQKKV